MSNYQVNLQFTADVAQARSQVQSLQQQLTSLVNTPVSLGSELTPSIQAATTAAAELKVHLQNAMNVNTGVLDFGKLNNSIKQSGMTLSEYGAKLQSLGPKGQQAFMTLANSVAAAEVPLRRSSGALTGLMTTLKNTAKWQLSSSLLHGFISSVQSAYSYAQDLNESLNNIRIVTGQNIEQMARFAQEANKAAKALSTTTTEYTNASLIYYQQGLNDAQVRERTDVTIKMANASRQSAEVVSDQLTAIWNNFDNGTKTLEYYADVVTALGAATASSSEEIATGLEKFASVAETVGLSYEYATAALATVTATTRQSADVVGTAFKTLFARLQDLKLGETLDDGTTLGTYSENLRKVGVEIKDSSGQLKDMDIILEEVAAKWQTLDRDQQVALAKGVAGIRQYNTFMSLMANWDFMEENLKTVESSGGTLQKQADIYAESWEAAQKRVKASAEKLYSTLFNDKFFIELTDGFGGLIDKVGEFVSSIGGLSGVLSSLGYIVTKVFAQQMAQGFRNLVYNIQMSTEAGQFAVQQAKKLEMEKLGGLMAKSSAATATEIQTRNVYSQELQIQTELIANSEKMTEAERQKYSILLEQHRTIGQQSIELQKQIELLKEQNSSVALDVIGEGMLNNSGMTRKDSFAKMNAEMDKMRTSAKGLGEVTMALNEIGTKSEASAADIDRLKAALKQAGAEDADIEDLGHCFEDLSQHGRTATGAMEEIKATLNSIHGKKIGEVLESAGIEKGTEQYQRLTAALRQYITTGSDAHIKETQLATTNKNLGVSFQSLTEQIKNAGVNMQDWATHLSGFVSGIMSAGMLISSINGLMHTLEDPDATGWEKFGSVLTSVAMIAMSFTGVIKGLTSVHKFLTAALNKETLAKVANTVASYLQEKQAKKTAVAQDVEEKETEQTTAEINKQTAAKVANQAVDFKGKNGRTRTFAGAKNKKGQLLDTNGNIISDKYVQKYNLNNFGKTPTTGQAPNAAGKTSLLNPGTLKTLGSALGKVAGVAAGIAIVATVITSAIAQYNRFEKAAQDAATAASMTSERYNDAKAAYEDFASTSSEYQESLKAMEELTKGTVEYKEALIKANEQAIELINNYRNLAGHYTIKDGLILIDEDALARVQQEELEKLGKIQASSILANSYSREKQSEADKINFNRDMNSRSDNIHTVQNAAVTTVSGMAAGALIGSSVPVIGTIIGGIVGLLGGIIATEVAGAQSRAEQEATNKVIMYVQEHGNDIFGAKNSKEFGDMLAKEGFKIDDDKLIQSLYDNRKALQDLTKVEVARLAQERADWSAAYAAYNQGNEDYMNAENQTYLNNAGYQRAEGLDSGLVAQVTKEVQMLWSGYNEDFWSAYLREVMHDTSVDERTATGDNYRVTDLGGDYVTLQKKNESGTWENVGEKDSLSESAAEAALIDARAMERASQEIPDLLEEYSKLSSQLVDAGLEENSDALQHILNARAGKEKIDLSSFGYEVMAGIDTSKILDSDLRDSVEVAIQDFKDALPEAMKTDAFEEYYNQLSDAEKELLWTIDIDKNYTLDQIRDVLEEAKILAAGEKLQLKIESTTDILELYKDPEKLEENKEVIRKYFDSLETGLDFDEFWSQSVASQEAFFKAILSDSEEELDNWIDDVNSRNYDEYKTEHYDDYEADKEARKTEAEGLDKEIKAISSAQQFTANEKTAIDGGDYTILLGNIATGAKYVGDTTSQQAASEFLADFIEGPWYEYTSAWEATHDGEEYSGTVADAFNDPVFQQLLKAYNLTIDDLTSKEWYKSYVANTLPKVMELDTTDKQTRYNELTADLSYEDWYAEQGSKAKELSVSARKSRQLNIQDRLGIDNDEFAAYTEQIQTVNQYLKDNQDIAEDVAIANLRMNKGIENLNSHLSDYGDILKDSTKKHTPQYTAALQDIRQDMADILDLNLSTLSDDFLTSADNIALMQKAAEGDAAAIEQLRIAAAKDIILGVAFDKDGISQSEKDVLAAINGLQAEDITIGCSLNNTQFGQSLYDAAVAAGSTVGDIREMFEALGWEPKIELKRVSVEDAQTMAGTSTVEVIDPITGEVTKVTGDMISQYATNGYVTVPSLNGEATVYKGGAAETANPKKPSGGGGSKPKKTEHTKKSDVVERYKEVNDQIDDIRNAMDDAKRAAEGLWGPARLKKMREVQSEMKKELQLMRQRRDEAKAYLEEDRAALQDAASKNGTAAFEFDAKGNITNYDEIMNGLYAELKAAQDAAGPTTDDKEQEKIDAIQERIDAIKEAIADFDETREQLEDFEDEIDEWILSIQEEKLNELNLQLEIQIAVDDSQLSELEYYLDKVQEDIWGMAEAAALMVGDLGVTNFGFDNSQVEVWFGALADFQKQYDDLLYNYTHIDPETGETYINQQQFIESLQDLQSQIYENLSNINELDKTMVSYYGDALAAANEELSKYTDLMDHHVDVLDHYSSLLDVMGKSKDYERMKTVLQAQVEVAKNSADVSKANYEMLQQQAEEKKAAWEAAKGDDTLSDYEKSVIEQQWLDAQNAANEAQSKMLEDAQAWAEALKSLLETELEELGENLEKALAGDFGSLDYMMTSMERANSLQEEYLTTTNKIYETNKLMRSAQQEIDKSTNSVAKRRMAQFIEETQQLQNQNKLSQYELEIQQAKYDLLLAEIALEEAQAAKSTVRLQRDSEGNFGYVYTADQNEVANAQQELEDAQNALYNIGLEGANKYAEQYAQTIQEMNDEIRDLTEQWQNGEIASKEEYQAKMLDLEAYYGEKLMQFSDLHSKAIMTDSRVANEAWTKDFATMTTKTQLWMQQVDVYVQGVEGSFARYQQGIDEVEKYAGMDLDSLAQKTEEIKNDNDALRDSIVDPDNGLIKAMEDEIKKVGELALAYAAWRKEIQGAIADQEDLARLINGDIEKESDDDESNDYKPEEETPPPPTEEPPEETPPEDTTPSYKKGTLTWTGSGGSRIWTDSTGKTYSASSAEGKAIQNAFDRAYSKNGGYKGDYWLGWNKLNADVLHAKYGLSTGGYTGDWAGSFGKLAFLHQKELVLNKQDTENLLTAMEFLNRIISAIDLQSMNNSLGGLLSSPSLGRVGDEGGILEQQVHIEASFPGITEHSELEQAFNNLINEAAQYANRK